MKSSTDSGGVSDPIGIYIDYFMMEFCIIKTEICITNVLRKEKTSLSTETSDIFFFFFTMEGKSCPSLTKSE